MKKYNTPNLCELNKLNNMNNLDDFTNLYSLSKTLRFELKPVGKTAKTFKQWFEELKNTDLDVKEDNNLFVKDQKIKDAYMVIKPIMDKLHEQYIEKALNEGADNIDFSKYFKAYQNKAVKDDMEKELRMAISDAFQVAGTYYVQEISKAQKDGKAIKPPKDKLYECLTDAKVLNYLIVNVKEFAQASDLGEKELRDHLEQFKGFWGYLDGYNTNRENYYATDKEASTAVATRIVHENLPTFCSNILRFEKRKEEYLGIYQYLKDNNRETKIKNEQGEEVEAEVITETIFQIEHFNKCLAQSQIEEYNRIIGNYNFLINLYNQARREETGLKKIDEFETLYKQIGCGKKESMFETLQDESDVRNLLQKAKDAGDVMFKGSSDVEINTLPAFVKFLQECDNWDGIYMSSAAVNKISNLYFANWHSIKDKLKEKNACATYDKHREEPIKLRDAVELSGLFAVLDTEQSELVFKASLFRDDETNEYCSVLDKALAPSKNLINLLCFDIERNIKAFLKGSDSIVALEKFRDENNQAGEEDQTINQIRVWFEAATDAMRVVRYFAVRKSKMKGNIPNVTMEQALSNLLYNDEIQWFKWYDLIRNYLTKKPQDDAKENMLKLNFGTSSLLGGWSDGQEKTKAATLLKHDNDLYLCILKTKNVFDTSKENNPIYINQSNASRLILRNLKFQTLAGKGFLGEYGISYGEMGKSNPAKAIQCLQKIIKERYVKKYPLLEKFVVNKYTDKSKFDAEINETLKECYVCEFVPIDWSLVTEKQNNDELFLFKIHCKDYEPKTTGKKDLQTMYWEDVLTDGSKHQLCAGAEIFMREPVANESPIKHRVGSKVVNKKDKDGKIIPEQIYREIYLYVNGKKKDISTEAQKYIDEQKAIIKDVKHEIIKDKRFYGEEPKYMFHCPIKLHFMAKGYKAPQFAFPEVNAKITDAIQESDNLQFIGIDRGEKHLVYSCTIDRDCKIIKCNHHDNINGTDYVQKLEAVADERIVAKKNWQAQNKIKDLKSGYISHVVHCLVEETIKDGDIIAPHAYIVLEDLNTEMKRGRQKIEKQVYQNLETALAKKLNFVVDKNAELGELGSVSKALQLTPPISNYQDIEGKKQFGVMLYTRANYTSVTDPATGWRKTIYIKNGKEEDIKNQILEKFSDFGFDGKDYYFEYTEAHAGHVWRMYSGKNGKSLPRFQNRKQLQQDKNVWEPEQINVVEILDKLFANFDKEKSFKEQIEKGVELKKTDRRSETAWQTLRYALDLIQQIRNSGEKNSKDDNFLYSPVRNENGEHFDTRNHKNNGALELIVDADANGAYNIARKGLIMDEHIKHWIKSGRPMKSTKKDEKTSDLDLFISDKEWDLWLLDRDQWSRELPTFASRSAKDDND